MGLMEVRLGAGGEKGETAWYVSGNSGQVHVNRQWSIKRKCWEWGWKGRGPMLWRFYFVNSGESLHALKHGNNTWILVGGESFWKMTLTRTRLKAGEPIRGSCPHPDKSWWTRVVVRGWHFRESQHLMGRRKSGPWAETQSEREKNNQERMSRREFQKESEISRAMCSWGVQLTEDWQVFRVCSRGQQLQQHWGIGKERNSCPTWERWPRCGNACWWPGHICIGMVGTESILQPI